jgi:hypothetical protein
MAETRVNASITDVTKNGTIWICEHMFRYQRSKGIFFNDNPFSFTLPVLFLQTSLVSVSTTILQHILEPIGQSTFFPQLLVIYLNINFMKYICLLKLRYLKK